MRNLRSDRSEDIVNMPVETRMEDESVNSSNKDQHKTLPFYKLFAFSDTTDHIFMVVGTIGCFANGLSMPLMSIIFGQLIDAFGLNQGSTHVLHIVSQVALKCVYLAVGVAVAASLQVVCWMATGERQSARIRSLYLKAVLRQDVAFFDTEANTGEVVSRMSGDTVLVQDAMGEKVGKAIQLASTFVGGLTVAFVRGWMLTFIMLSSLPLVAASGAAMALILSKTSTKGQAAYAKASIVVDQTIGSIITVVSFTGEKRAVQDYNKAIATAYRSSVQEGWATGLGLGSVLFGVFGSYALAIWFGSKMIIERGYSGGIVLNVIIAVLTGSMSLGQISPCLTAFGSGQAAAYKIFQIINRKPEIDVSDMKGEVLEDIRGDVELRDVYFSYPARPDEPIFRGFSISISSGTMTALVGHSGSGKSTVISLIERFYDPQVGQVLIDGINLKDFQLKWIRSKIGLVSQEPVLFASSIRENIAYGKDGATEEEIRTATQLANAAIFIDKLPQGLDTLVGEHGTQLSGGQKQRVALARAILKDPRILLLDEATSALDAESEKIVQDALQSMMVNRTTIVVAHRLSTVRNADMIVVIHQGKVVEKGTHCKLLEHSEGAYSQLIRLQEMKNESEEPKTSTSSLWSLSKGSSRIDSSESVLPLSIAPNDNDLHSLTDREADTNVPLCRVSALNKPEIPMLLLGTLAAIANGCVFPVFGLLLSTAVKMFYEPHDQLKKDSKFWAAMVALLGVASLLANPSQTYFYGVAGGRLIQRIRSRCFEKVVSMEISWFDEPKNSSGAIGARLSADAAAVRGLVGDALGLLVQNITTAIAGLVIAFTANWILALVIIVLLPLLVLNGYAEMKFLKGFSADAKKKYEGASQVASDAVGSIRTIASFCAEEKVIKLYESKCEEPMKAGIRLGLVTGIGFGVSSSVLFLVYAVNFYAGAQLVGHGKATVLSVFRVILSLTTAAIGIAHSSTFSPDFSKAKSAVSSIFAILDRESKIDASNESGAILGEVKGEFELKHVSFKYPTRPTIRIFSDINLVIHAGKTVALVGESGSGKSTIISLLQRFYDPDSGVITLDGNEIQNLQLKWLSQQMGLVSQEPVLFNNTIRANIAYGKGGNATEAEIVAAAELANAHNFISALQQGYDTIVGERGTQLSGGQKQRVAIARAIVKSPKILLLDEATSALDAESERVVQDALDRVMMNRTTVVVAHRLSTIRNADLIAVVKNGVIAEKGKHDTLVQIRDGLYASLVALHMSASEIV